MKTAERIALVYAAALAGAGAISYWRGRRSTDMFQDVALHGLLLGTGLNVVAWLALEDGTTAPVVELAQQNGAERVTKLTEQGRTLLGQLNTARLYAEQKWPGVKVAPVPQDEAMISQDND